MSAMKLSKADAQWYKDFNFALRANKKSLTNISGMTDIVSLYKTLSDSHNASRRDFYHKSLKINFNENNPIVPICESPEEAYVNYIDAPRPPVELKLVREKLNIGEKVMLMIDGHFYNHQTGYVREYRAKTNEYLVEITSKYPHKPKYPMARDAKALVYVNITELKVVKKFSPNDLFYLI